MKTVQSTLLTALICLGGISSSIQALNLPTAIKHAWINYPQTKEYITIAATACAAVAGAGIEVYKFFCMPNRRTKSYMSLSWLGLSTGTMIIIQNVALIPLDYCYKLSLDDLSNKINNKALLTRKDMQKTYALFQYQLKHHFYNKYARADHTLNRLMGYDYGKIDFFAHPQLNSDEKFITMFLDACLEEVNNTKHLKNRDLATIYTSEHPDFVKAYVQRIQEDSSHFYVKGNDVCADVIIQTYIQNYMQPDKIERLCTFLLKHNLPGSTQAIKEYMIDDIDYFVKDVVLSQINNKHIYLTPLNDYFCSVFVQCTRDAQQHRELLGLILEHRDLYPDLADRFPLTLAKLPITYPSSSLSGDTAAMFYAIDYC